MKLNYSQPSLNLSQDALEKIQQTLASNWWASGPKIKEYEEAVADFTGYRFAISVSSATAGLEVAYSWYFSSLKYVFIPTLTFVATANVAYRQGLEIKLSDADDKTLNTYGPDVSVSLGGFPLYGRGLVADSSHYFHENMKDGTDYKAAVLSHHAVKPLSCGEGGTILTDDEEFYHYAREYRDHGRSNGFAVFAGNNVRMTELQATILLLQLDDWHRQNSRRHEIAQMYNEQLKDVVELPPYNKRHSLHLYMIKLQDKEQRESVRTKLFDKMIGTQIHYNPVHNQPLYQHITGEWPVANDHYARSLSIPMHPGLTDTEVQFVIEAIKKSL